MKYLSIDIETTGLDPNTHQILEMAAILDDTEHPETPVENLPYFRAVVNAVQYIVDPYCAQLHSSGLWQEIITHTEAKVEHTTYCETLNLLYYFKFWLNKYLHEKETISPAGKNFGSFDLQFLRRYALMGDETLPFKHRAFDPGSLYFLPDDKEIPSLPTCLSRAGLSPTNLHSAYGDALDVIRVLRPKISKN